MLFKLFVPVKKSESISTITLHCYDRTFEDTELKSVRRCFWEATISVPEGNKFTYSYIIAFRWSVLKHEINGRHVYSRPFQRDIYNKKSEYIIEGLAMHTADIINNECTLEKQLQEVKYLLDNIREKITEKGIVDCLLKVNPYILSDQKFCHFMICYILKYCKLEAKELLTPQAEMDIIKHLSTIPDSVLELIYNGRSKILEIFKNGYPNCCYLQFTKHCLRILPPGSINTILESNMTRTECERGMSSDDIMQLFLNLCNVSDEDQIPIMEKLFHVLCFKDMNGVLTLLQEQFSANQTPGISDFLVKAESLVEKEILKTVTGNLSQLCEDFKLINIKNKTRITISVQNGVIRYLESIIESASSGVSMKDLAQNLSDLHDHEKLFNSQEDQLLVLNTISHFMDDSFRTLFLKLCSDNSFSEDNTKALGTIVINWFQVTTKISRERDYGFKRAKNAYKVFSDISKLKCFSYIQKDLECVFIAHKQLPMKKFIELMTYIDHLSEAAVDLYCDHLHVKTSESNLTFENLTEILQDFHQKINTRTTAALVTSILLVSGKKESLTFREILNRRAFWEMVFHSLGGAISEVHSHSVYLNAKECLQKAYMQLENREFDYKFLKNLAEQKDYISDFMAVALNKECDTVKNVIDTSFKLVEKAFTEISRIKDFIESLQPHVPDYFQEICSEAIKSVKGMDNDLKSSQMNIQVFQSLEIFDNKPKDIRKSSSCIVPFIDSKTFWHKNIDDISTLCENLYGKYRSGPLSAMQKLSNFLSDQCVNHYKTFWADFVGGNVRLSTFFDDFSCLSFDDMNCEIALAEKLCGVQFLMENKSCLTRIYRVPFLIERMHAVANLKDLFGFTISERTQRDFDDLAFLHAKDKEVVGKWTYVKADIFLKKMESEILNFSDIITETMSVLSTCSELLIFVKDIIHEDIRNLMDAAEGDYFDQYLSVVANLVEVKEFLTPLLTIPDDKPLDILEFIEILRTSFETSKDSKLAVKCDECSSHLHNLKDFYQTFANRTEKTRDRIDNIISIGKFQFLFEGNICTVQVKCNELLYTLSDLSDLRSRALLIQSRFEKSKQFKGIWEPECEVHHTTDERQKIFKKFLKIVDVAVDISELYSHLHRMGHPHYLMLSREVCLEDLDGLKEDLTSECIEWRKEIKGFRNQHYVLNFIRADQLPILYKYLVKGEERDNAHSLFRYINPNFDPEQRKIDSKKIDDELQVYLRDESPKAVLNLVISEIGRHLENISDRKRCIPKSVTERTFYSIQKGQLVFMQLDANSNISLQTILSIYVHSTESLPESNQIIICSENTTWDEIKIFLKRIKDSRNSFAVLYCIAFVELLHVDVQHRLVRRLQKTHSDRNAMAVVYRGKQTDTFPNLFKNFTIEIEPLSKKNLSQMYQMLFPNVAVYTSDMPGQGKTEAICEKSCELGLCLKTVHLSGMIYRNTIVEKLCDTKLTTNDMLHLDIGLVSNGAELDTFLFELVVLGYMSSEFTSFALSSEYVAIELANTPGNTMLDMLPTTACFKRFKIQWNNYNDLRSHHAINSPMQVVCSYLDRLDTDKVSDDIEFSEIVGKNVEDERCRELLRAHFGDSPEMNFTVLNIFISVLSEQFKKLSSSSYFRQENLESMVGSESPRIKRHMIEALISFSKEFASRSISTAKKSQTVTWLKMNQDFGDENCDENVITLVKGVEEMARWEMSNHLVVVFHSQDTQTVSALYRKLDMVPSNVRQLFESQIKRPLHDFETLKPHELLTIVMRISRSKKDSMSEEMMISLTETYAVTPDNLLKMALLSLRIQARVPIVIMGETGCGKTTLIRNLAKVCGVKLHDFSVHAGTSENEIISKVQKCNNEVMKNQESDTWLFFDELNTSEHVGLISDIICHKKLRGKRLAPKLSLIAACNPYRFRPNRSYCKIGLQGKMKNDGLSMLAYRVHPLPECMLDYVWDYGSLSLQEERMYIERMVHGNKKFEPHGDIFVELLAVSQQFVREKEKPSCTVSLRDVDRCKRLAEWFSSEFLPKLWAEGLPEDKILQAFILSLSICYYCRFTSTDDRLSYTKRLADIFPDSYNFSAESISQHIKKQQERILQKMDLPLGTASNTALRENVFVILVCILNKIPIFLVGKPGCSKSLSLQVIRSNMRGPDSKDSFFKMFPRLYYSSFQGSESSTSDGILKVFDRAKKYQMQDRSVLPLVILDEIGLAEISRFNPLKVLHSLLEPEDKTTPDVAVVGISNWALDAAKMNRAIHLSRPDMNTKNLLKTGLSIISSVSDNCRPQSDEELKQKVNAIAESYVLYTKEQPVENFHGLRDYYNFVKYISTPHRYDSNYLSDVEKQTGNESFQLLIGILRNFGGLQNHMDSMKSIFARKLKLKFDVRIPVSYLIRENINDHGSRHLMLILNGDSAIGSLEDLIGEERRECTTILGSKFSDDQDDDYNYRMLNKIILCMEQPNILILKDLENIYGSLYDMLNQNYTIVQKKKHCRVALGPYSNPTCEVNNEFKCIVLVDERNLTKTDPPFLNRFEKQQFLLKDIIDTTVSQTFHGITNVIKDISVLTDKTNTFAESDIFPIFSEGFVSTLIAFVRKKLKEENEPHQIIYQCILELLWIVKPDAFFRMECSKLHQNCKASSKIIQDLYFALPIHSGLGNYIKSLDDTARTEDIDFRIPLEMKEIFDIYFSEAVEKENVLFSQIKPSEWLMVPIQNIEESNETVQSDTENKSILLERSVNDDNDTMQHSNKESFHNKNSSHVKPDNMQLTDDVVHQKNDNLTQTENLSSKKLWVPPFTIDTVHIVDAAVDLERHDDNDDDSVKDYKNMELKGDVTGKEKTKRTNWNTGNRKLQHRIYRCKISDAIGRIIVVFTYSTIYADIRGSLAGLQYSLFKLGEFHSEKQITKCIQEFWSNREEKQILILQCEVREDIQHLLLAKSVIENTRNQFKRTDGVHLPKHVCMVLHIDRHSDPNTLFSKINFLSSWDLVTLDSIEAPVLSTRDFYKKSIIEVLKMKKVSDELVSRELFWAMTQMQYGGQKGKDFVNITEELSRSATATDVLSEFIFDWLRDNHEDTGDTEWQIEAACNKHLLYTSTTMIGALENHISEKIRQPLAMLLYKLEVTNALACLTTKMDKDKTTMMSELMRNPKVFKIDDIPKPTGPGCYIVQSRVAGMHMPFAFVFFEQLEEYKEPILSDLRKANIPIEDWTEEEDMDDYITSTVKDIVKSYTDEISKKLGLLRDYNYAGMKEDCIDDFCKYITSRFTSKMSILEQNKVTRWLFEHFVDFSEEDIVLLLIQLHTWAWINTSRIVSVIGIMDTAISALGQTTDILLEFSQEKQTLSVSIKHMLEHICRKLIPTSCTLSSLNIIEWQQHAIRLISALSTSGVDSEISAILKFFHDVAKIIYIPLAISTKKMEKFADYLEENNFQFATSKCLFKLWDFLDSHRDEVDSTSKQRVFCMYLQRCLTHDDSNDIMMHALQLIAENKIFDNNLGFFGPCLRFSMLDYEIDTKNQQMQDEIFYNILSDENQGNLLIEQDPFLFALDGVIMKERKQFCPLTVLLVDILQNHVYSKLLNVENVEKMHRSDPLLNKLFISKTLMKSKKKGLQFTTAVAYTRMFTVSFTSALIKRNCRSLELLQAFDHFLDLSEGVGIANFFLRCITRSVNIFKVLQLSVDLKEEMNFFEKLVITPELIENMIESLHLSRYDKRYTNMILQRKHSEKEILEKAVQQSSSDSHQFVALVSVLQSRIYLKQFYSSAKEVDNQMASIIIRLAESSSLAEWQQNLFEHFSQPSIQLRVKELGVWNSAIDCDILMLIFLSHLAVVIPSFSSNENVFYRAMFYPNTNCKSRGEESLEDSTEEKCELRACICGYRIIVPINGICPICPEGVTTTGRSVDSLTHRDCSYLSSSLENILEILYHGAMLCSDFIAAEDTLSDNMIRKSGSKIKESWHQFCLANIVSDTEMFHILILFIEKNKDLLTDSNISAKKEKFSRNLLDLLSDKHNQMQRDRKQHNKAIGIKEVTTYDNGETEDNETEHHLFRLTEKPSFLNMQLEAESLGLIDKHPFLYFAFQRRQALQFPVLIMPLLDWHKQLLGKCSYSVKKVDCKYITVGTFITQQKKEYQPSLRQSFKTLLKTWNVLRENISLLKRYNSSITNLEAISVDNVIDDCMIRDETSPLLQVIYALVRIQNEIIDTCLKLLANSKSHLFTFSQYTGNRAAAPCVSIMDLRKRHLIQFEFDDNDTEELISAQSQSSLYLGTGRQITYDFQKIESDIAHKITHNKPFISIQNPMLSMEFKDDLYRHCVQLLKKISTIVSQRALEQETVNKVKEMIETNPTNLPELLKLIGTIATLLYRNNMCRDEPIVKFLDRYESNVKFISMNLTLPVREILPSQEHEISLSHTVSLYRLLEEINGEKYTEALDDKFKTSIEKRVESRFRDVVKDNMKLLKLFLSALFIFIHRFLFIGDNAISTDQPLADYLQDVDLWGPETLVGKILIVDGKDPDSQADVEDVVMPEFLVCHTWTLVKFIKNKIADYEDKNEIPMRQISMATVKKKKKRAFFGKV